VGPSRDFHNLWNSHACSSILYQTCHTAFMPRTVPQYCVQIDLVRNRGEFLLLHYYSDYRHLLYKICLYIMKDLGSRSTAVVVVTSGSGVVGVAVIIEVDLVDSLLQHVDHGVERTETILVNGAASVRVRDGNDSIVDQEADLLGHVSGGAGHDLSGEVSGEGNDLASDEGVGAGVTSGAERGPIEQGCEVESGEGIENNDFVSSISIDGLVQREVS
jgi:hypothetical protein